MAHQFDVPAEFEGQRLDRFLVSVLGDLSRSQIQRLITDGHVSVANRAAKSNLALRERDRVSVDVPDAAPSTVESEELPLEILYQDPDVAVLNKPAGMVVHPAAGHASGTSTLTRSRSRSARFDFAARFATLT